MKLQLRLPAAALAFLLTTPALFAQASDGNIIGTITDPSGAVIANAGVEITNTGTGVKAKTTSDALGVYRFNNVLIGRYDITANASGFVTQTIKNFAVELNRTNTANVTLQVGQQAQTIEITDAAAAIDTTTSQLSSNYEARQVDLGLAANVIGANNYGANNLSLLSAGVASSGGVGYGAGPSVGGQRPTNNNFIIDGIDNNRRDVTGPITYVPPDATASFTLIQNMAAPEFGHSSGGTFNTVVKSGSNQVHGSLYDYMTNKNLNALDASFKRQGISERTRLDNNRLGATIGGPIRRNKLFYFGNFEYNPYGLAGTPAAEVLTPTAEGYAALDRIQGLSTTNLGILKQYAPASPRATDSTTVAGQKIAIGTLPIVAPSYQNQYAYVGSIDYELSEKDHFRYRFIGNNIRAINNNPTLPVFYSNQPTNAYNTNLSWLRNFSPTLLNEFRFGYTRFYNQVPVGDFKFPGLDQFPNITIDDDLNLQLGPDPNGPQGTIINAYTLVNNSTWIKGRHTVKAGYDGRRLIAPQFFVQRVRGDYNYSDLDRYLRDLTPDHLAERSFGASAFWGNLWSHYLFANDDIKLRPNLTLNVGIRWEYVGVPDGNKTQKLNSLASVPGLIDFHSPTAQKGNFAPRLGIVWSPGNSGTTSVRAGFGMAYDQVYQNLGILSLPPQFFTTADAEGDAPNFLKNGGIKGGAGGNLSAADARQATASFVPDQKRPYSINWTLGVQKVLWKDYTFEVRYLGTKGVNLPMQIRLNRGAVVTQANSLPLYTSRPSQAELNGLPLTLNALQAQQHPTFAAYRQAGFLSNIVAFMPIGNSNYHGMAVEMRKRFSHDLTFTTAYTWSHSIDDGTASVFSTYISPRRAQDFLNLRPEKSSSALDRRQRLTVGWNYETPWFRSGSNFLAKHILGGYIINGSYIAESPMYGVVQSGVDSNLNGDTAGDRVIINPSGTDRVGSGVTALTNAAGRTVAYLANNPNARYIVAGAGAYANGGRMTLPLRGINNWDVGIGKSFAITEVKKIQFRADMGNFFNHSQFTPGATSNIRPVSRTDTRNYLLPSNGNFANVEPFFANNARQIQLLLRFIF